MFTHVTGYQMHDAVLNAMIELDKGHTVTGENQDKVERQKEIKLIMDVENIKDLTMIKAFPTDLYGLVEYDLEFIEGVRDFEPEWEYTYHRLYAEFLDECIEELKREKSTRRSVLPIAGKLSYGNAHPPCLQEIMFRIENNKLDTTAVFRSNDGAKAVQMNTFAIARLAHKVAKEVGVEVGGYSHIANSFHAYESDWDMLHKYVEMLEKENKYFTLEEFEEAYDEYADEYRKKCKDRENSLKNRIK